MTLIINPYSFAGGGAPAFPVNGILDNFNRADGALGANWGGKLFSGDSGGCTVVSNQASCTASQSDYWSASTFGPDCEVYATLPSTAGPFGGIFARAINPGTGTFCAYEVYIYQPGSVLQVYRIDNGTYNQLGADIAQTISNGDSAGIEIIGSTITVYYKVGAGAWASVGSRTDATYSGAGYIGIEGDGGTFPFENFGGGTR